MDNKAFKEETDRLLKLDDAMLLVAKAFNNGEVLLIVSELGLEEEFHAHNCERIKFKHKRMEPK